jgi:Zn-dependent protease with chaperone function
MTPLLVVAGSALVLGAGTPLALQRLRGLERWPMLNAWFWLASSVGALTAVALAGLLLLMPDDPLGPSVAELLRTCVMALRAALSSPQGGRAETAAGLLLLAAVASGLVIGGSVAGLRAWRAAGRHRELLALAGRPATSLAGVTVLEHGRPFAYCLPGRPGPVVLSSATLHRLEPGQLAAVLAHERAHQAGRHHWLVLLAQALRVGFPWLPAARLAGKAVARLVELVADDAAARAHGRRQVAAALAALGDAPVVPTVALGAAVISATERVSRLLTPRQHGGGLALLAGLLVLGLPLIAVVVAVALPLARVAGVPVCPLD